MHRFWPLYLAVCLLRAQALHSEAAAGTWQPSGPDGGTVGALTVDPTDADVVYASTQLGPLFKTTDGGESWHALSGFPTGSVEP
jgi:photosystem II stability/assembly factor-like uncharacterized protein